MFVFNHYTYYIANDKKHIQKFCSEEKYDLLSTHTQSKKLVLHYMEYILI